MAKLLHLLFYLIFVLNIVFGGINLIVFRWWNLSKLHWIENAAKEVVEVESISCSGHGRAFLDGFVGDGDNDGKLVCECYACYTGPNCSIISPPCIADADSGDPLFMEPYWMNQKERSGVIVPGWHRMGYTYPNENTMSLELEKYVRKLHELVGNAYTEGMHIVFGAGTTQLTNASVHALSSSSYYNNPGIVVASVPFYTLYQEQTDFFRSQLYKFGGDASLWKNKTRGANATFIEFVTSPNNPDGDLKEAVLKGNSVKTIYDRVYYWPHFTPITKPAKEDLMLFSVSKFTGHAGSRFGWALVKDKVVHQKMVEYVTHNTFGVSQDTQLRMLKILKAVIRGKEEIFEAGHKMMKERWERLKIAFSASSRFSLQYVPPRFFTFSQQIREATPAYAWLKCERRGDVDCYEIFKAANIIGRSGQSYGADKRYVRLSLIKSQDDFELLLHNIELLVSIAKNEGIKAQR